MLLLVSSSISLGNRWRQCGSSVRVLALRSGDPGFETRPEHSLNGQFPSSWLLPLQNESKCEVFVMVISSTLHGNENLFS